jgi:hypothetical protein
VSAVSATAERGAKLLELGAAELVTSVEQAAGPFDTTSDTTYGADLATLIRLVAEGRLHPEIGSVRSWSQTAEVIADLRTRRIQGQRGPDGDVTRSCG